MNNPSVIRKNLSLVVGVSLPLLLVILFWAATVIPRMRVAPPQYDLLISSSFNPDRRLINGTLDFEVTGGRLIVRFNKNVDENYSIQAPRLYLFSASTQSLREINFDLPENPPDNLVIPVSGLNGNDFITESVSPDGYRFDNRYRGSRGFLFFNGYRYNAKIEKQGRAVKIPLIDGSRYYGNYTFVAWTREGGQ